MSDCDKCKLNLTCLHPDLRPEGPIATAEILIVAEAPGEWEDILERPLIGDSGQILRRALCLAGIEVPYEIQDIKDTPFVKNVVLHNVCTCRPQNNATPTGVQTKCCFDKTLDLIEKMPNLKLIVPVGNIALRAFTGKQGITGVSGTEMEWDSYKMMPLIHPASYLHAKDRKNIKVFYDHVARIPAILQENLVTSDFGIYITVDSIDKWREFKRTLKDSKYFIYDIETTGLNPFKENQDIKLITFSVKYKEAWALPLDIWDDAQYIEIISDLKEIFEDSTIGKIGQNIKYDNLWMRAILNIYIEGTIGDTKLSQYILHPNDSNHLKDMAWAHTGCGGYEKNLSVDVQDAVGQELWTYGCTDSDICHRIFLKHQEEFKLEPKLFNAYSNLLVPTQIALTDMEYNGIRINPARLNAAYVKSHKILKESLEEILNYPTVKKYTKKNKAEFNPNSHNQIQKVLFGEEYEGLKPIKLTGKKRMPSTDKTVFEFYKDINGLAALFNTYSQYKAMDKTFKEILGNLTTDHRIHTTYWITETKSGRSSSRDPNLQNIPKGDKDLTGIRRAFIADPDFYLVEFDFNQHELRCMAEEADDDALRKALLSDVHAATTASILGISIDQVTEEQRRLIGKTFNFGLIYGMTIFGIIKKMKLVEKYQKQDKSLTFKQAKFLAEKEAQIYLDKFFGIYSKTKQWMDNISESVKENRYVWIRSGFKKYFPPEIKLTDHEIRSAINIPIQGLAGHILFYALIGVNKFLKFNKFKSKLLLEVHDSIVAGIHKDELEIIPEIKHIMKNFFKKYIPNFKTPIEVDVKIGESWGNMEKI